MTAYELCISDWSSDVCSSDLRLPGPDPCRDARSCPRDYDGDGRRQSYGMGDVSARARSWTRGEMADNRDASSGASCGLTGELWSLFPLLGQGVRHRYRAWHFCSCGGPPPPRPRRRPLPRLNASSRSAERRVGKEGVSTCRTGG